MLQLYFSDRKQPTEMVLHTLLKNIQQVLI